MTPASAPPFLYGLLQQRENTPFPEQGCAAAAGCSGHRTHSSDSNSRRNTPSLCSDLISNKDRFSKMLTQAFYGGTKDHASHGIPNARMRPISGVDRNSPRRCRRQTLSFSWGYGERGHASLWHASLEPAIQAPTMHIV